MKIGILDGKKVQFTEGQVYRVRVNKAAFDSMKCGYRTYFYYVPKEVLGEYLSECPAETAGAVAVICSFNKGQAMAAHCASDVVAVDAEGNIISREFPVALTTTTMAKMLAM